jgi:tetratricopeptide (TPR) repeat protein
MAVEASVPATADDATMATLVVLHTGAALLDGEFSGVNPQLRTEASHFAAAHKLVGLLSDRVGANPNLRAFCSSWYILAASLWCANGQVAAAERTLRAGHGLLDDDPEFLLAAGTVDEALMGPYANPAAAAAAHAQAPVSLNVREMKTTAYGFLTTEYVDAEHRLKKAVSLRPDLVEARLRLGRVYVLLDRPTEARPEFEQVLREAPRGSHPFAAAVAALFLGQLHERAGRFDDAKKAYELAISLQPADQAPYLALGHLLVASGRVDEGWAVVRRMLEGPGGSSKTSSDSYHQYREGQWWQANQRMAALEAWIRR